MRNILVLLSILIVISCNIRGQRVEEPSIKLLSHDSIRCGADQFVDSSLLWEGKRLGLVVNQSSVLSDTSHIVDRLVEAGADIRLIFAPEHGFRGFADAGEAVADGKDKNTGTVIRSLYGKSKRPSSEDLAKIDLLVFDIQDVGVRFYTYLSTLFYCMEAAAEQELPILVLDRPNPNGFYVDGPILENEFKSFVGALPIPIVHGMTMGEMALMIQGEFMDKSLDLNVIPVEGYQHQSYYMPPVYPSPNLRSVEAILLYPHLCYFEATRLSVGRGTKRPFEIVGHPDYLDSFDEEISPKSDFGASKPKYMGQVCKFQDMTKQIPLGANEIMWEVFWNFNHLSELDTPMIDRPKFLNLLMGTNSWEKYLDQPVNKFRENYKMDLQAFKKQRSKYLLYNDTKDTTKK